MEQEQARLKAENLYLQEEIKADHNFEEIVGQSPAHLATLENVRQGRADRCFGSDFRRNGDR